MSNWIVLPMSWPQFDIDLSSHLPNRPKRRAGFVIPGPNTALAPSKTLGAGVPPSLRTGKLICLTVMYLL